ncbi:PREDICTED: uncharacterized protein LOC109221823 [Nicotiana attenuata]|uniref:uncharacterized protein LOC109221823 n=1 Tax=Nicotiana attenuata TaxID=49451 RepID=UPI000904EDA4|nr:PREDICTED: uncharacterized protein LOC109221823 [Nicotiana attenuata]
MDEVAVMGLRTYMLEVENIRRANVRTDPRNWALGEELEKKDQELMQALCSNSELEEQIRLKDEELEIGKGIAVECEHLQGKLRAMQLEMEQSQARTVEMNAEWSGKLAVLESKVADLKRMEEAALDASARAAALEAAIRVHESERESERATAALKEARLEERIGVADMEALALSDQIAALEEENQRLRAQAGSSRDAAPRQAHELQVYAEAQRDIFKNLSEVDTVPEAAFEEARQKARKARANCGYDEATPEVDGDASGDDDNDGVGAV